MKKLVFIASAVLAFCANAASCAWDVDTIYDPSTGKGSTGFLVYYFDADATPTGDATAALGSKNLATINAFLAGGYEADDLTDDGYTAGNPGGIYGNSQDVNAYLVVFNASTVEGATHAFVSAVESDKTGALGQPASISFGDLDASASLSNWTPITSDIPEPTSGLLMLVGLGALSLRRRRA